MATHIASNSSLTLPRLSIVQEKRPRGSGPEQNLGPCSQNRLLPSISAHGPSFSCHSEYTSLPPGKHYWALSTLELNSQEASLGWKPLTHSFGTTTMGSFRNDLMHFVILLGTQKWFGGCGGEGTSSNSKICSKLKIRHLLISERLNKTWLSDTWEWPTVNNLRFTKERAAQKARR